MQPRAVVLLLLVGSAAAEGWRSSPAWMAAVGVFSPDLAWSSADVVVSAPDATVWRRAAGAAEVEAGLSLQGGRSGGFGESASLTSINAIQIGWEVKPSFYGDSHTHLAGIWTTDGFQKTGCPNMNCPGYQRENGTSIALGDIIEHVSQPNGAKQFVTIKVLKDKVSGDWLVYYGLNKDPELIGRFPKSLFTGGLADRGTTIKVGGFVQAPATDLAPMGNGYLPTKPTGAAAASFSEINFFDKDGHATRVTEDLPVYVSDPATYSLTNMADSRFFYGGPSQPSA